MNANSILPVTESLAAILFAAGGFCLLIRAVRLASRLFAAALFVIAAPFIVLTLLGTLHGALHNVSIPPAQAAWLLGAFALLILACLIWFAVNLKFLHMLQNWIVPRFGPEVDGQVTGTHLIRLLDRLWMLVKLLGLAGILIALLLLMR